MQTLFQKLFNAQSGETTQVQREALVDLCLLGMYSDSLISVAEQDFLDEEFEQLKWESGIAFSGYLQRTIPKVRAAKDNSQEMKALLQDIDQRLGNADFKRSAIAELEKLLSTDGVVKLEEEFLAEVKAVAGL